MFRLFLKTKGLIDRREYWMGFAGLTIFIIIYNAALRALGIGNMISFWLITFCLPLMLYMIYCVYGKRLSDMGRSRWPFVGAVVLQILVIIALMLAFGGADYFYEFSQYDRKDDIDPIKQQAIIDTYQARQAANMHIIRPAMTIVPILLTLWLGIAPSKDR